MPAKIFAFPSDPAADMTIDQILEALDIPADPLPRYDGAKWSRQLAAKRARLGFKVVM